MEGIPGNTDDPRRHDALAWVSLIVAVVLVLALALLAVGFVGEAASSHRANAGASRPVDAILGVVCIGLAALCGRWAVHSEHRLRHRNPVARSYAAGPFGSLTAEPSGLGGLTGQTGPSGLGGLSGDTGLSGLGGPTGVTESSVTVMPSDTTTAAQSDMSVAAQPDTFVAAQSDMSVAAQSDMSVAAQIDTPDAALNDTQNDVTTETPSLATTRDTPIASVEPSRAPRPRRTYAPVALSILTGVFALCAIGLIIGTLISISQASRSSYVQNHGIRTLGTVTFVNDIQHCNSNGTSCYYTSQISVTLHPPVDGASSTTVYAPFSSSLNAGDTVTVLVDPHELGYAELPGSPYVTTTQWIVLGAVAVLLIVLALLSAIGLISVLRHRRSVRAVGAPAPAI
jgi:hypothetical protein